MYEEKFLSLTLMHEIAHSFGMDEKYFYGDVVHNSNLNE